MIRDHFNQFSRDQAITVTAGSTNYLDQQSVRNLGAGYPIELFVQVTTAFTTGDGATLTVSIEADNDSAFGSPTTLAQSASAIAAATLVAGYEPLRIKIPEMTPERYLRVKYTVGTGTFTGGKIDAELVLDRQSNYAYPRGYTV